MSDDDKFGTPAHMLTRNTDPGTSHAAGQAVNTTKREKLVYDTIAEHGGLTCGQVCTVTGESMHSLSPRFSGLEQKHLIYYKPGEVRRSRAGRAQRVARIERRRIIREQQPQEASQEESQPESHPGI